MADLPAQFNPPDQRLVITSPTPMQDLSAAAETMIRWQSDLGEDVIYNVVYSTNGVDYGTEVASGLTSTVYGWKIDRKDDLVGWVKVKAYRQGYLLAEDSVKMSFLPRDCVLVSRADQRVFHFASGKLVNVFTCSTALPQYDLQEGDYRVYLRERSHWSKEYQVEMPHSLFFHKGYALHATRVIRLLGRPASHGCVRLHPRDARELYEQVKVGTPVIVPARTKRCSFLEAAFRPVQTAERTASAKS